MIIIIVVIINIMINNSALTGGLPKVNLYHNLGAGIDV